MSSRIAKVQTGLKSDCCFLVTNPINVRYLCGYSGSNGILKICAQGATLYTDARYELQAEAECFDVDVCVSQDLYKAAFAQEAAEYCWFESAYVTVAISERLNSVAPKVKFSPSEISIEALRVIKDSSELALIQKACEISTAALGEVIAKVHAGQTERQVSVLLERTMIDMGADAIAFESIVASGPNSAIAHHQPADREISQGDLLKIDFGAKVAGYHSDCTRTFVIGKASAWQLDIHQAVLTSQSASRSVVKTGVMSAQVLEQTTSALTASGYLQNFRHGLGHGVGLEIHEDPFLSAVPTTTLDSGTVITIEPGVYLPNQGGVRIEDTIVVTDTGYENLTVFAYELQEIG